jgi:predicted TIM-barrel fold metal-dependent hydrolase
VITRRSFSLWLAGAILAPPAGCGRRRAALQPDLARNAIDIHAHVFNGRDVPVIGFLEQVILRDPHTPPDQDILSESFLALLKSILLAGTPTAAEELAALGGRAAPAADADLLAQDEQNVANGIAGFSGEAARSLSVTARADAIRILDRLAAELGQAGLRTRLQTPEAEARAVAAEIFRRGAPGALITGTPIEYIHASPFVQTIRWAGLLTRSRYDLVATFNRLYGGDGHIRIFAPSLVDLGAWFLAEERVTPIDEQVEVLSAIARKVTDALVLPFVAFCPLRAALESEQGRDPLRHVRHAVLERGFVGVKLYPPMGFRPIGNDIDDLPGVPHRPAGGAQALDAALAGLYQWCVTNDVPIMAHANNSMSASPGAGAFADPAGWRGVFDQDRFRTLRLNLAHFGGFEESAPRTALASPGDWEDSLAEMVERYPGLYFDLGYWTEAANDDSPQRQHVVERMRQLLARSPTLATRMMYGSDWSMIGREPAHPAYLAGLRQTLEADLGLPAPQIDAVMGGNAAAFLGLDRQGPQQARVATFYGDNPIYQKVFQT